MHLCIPIVTIIGAMIKSIILKKWYLSIYINYIMLYSIIKYLSIPSPLPMVSYEDQLPTPSLSSTFAPLDGWIMQLIMY